MERSETGRDTADSIGTDRLVIFDCDGVLVDSEVLAIRVLVDAIRRAGARIEEDEAYRLFLGRSLATVTECLRSGFGLEAGPDFLEDMRQALYARFRAELKPVAGMAETLDALRARGIATCVASSSQPERIRLALTLTGLADRLEPHIFSASMVARGKPAPDLFLHAARAMNRAPEHCLVVEDSPAGVAAARAAGMRVLLFTGATHAAQAVYRRETDDLTPDARFDAMPDLLHLVGTV